MPDMEALGDVDRGIVDHDRLALAGMIAAVGIALRKHRGNDLFGIRCAIDEEIQIALYRFDLAEIIGVNRVLEGIGDHHRALAQRFGQLKARKRIIAHRGVRRNLQTGRNLLNAERLGIINRLQRRGDLFGNGKFEIHGIHS